MYRKESDGRVVRRKDVNEEGLVIEVRKEAKGGSLGLTVLTGHTPRMDPEKNSQLPRASLFGRPSFETRVKHPKKRGESNRGRLNDHSPDPKQVPTTSEIS